MNLTSISRQAILFSYFGLLGLIFSWITFLAPPSDDLISFKLLLYGGPLLLPLVGILKGKSYTYAWTTFVVLFYFMHGVGEAYSTPDERWLALAEVFFSVVLFISLIVNIRMNSERLVQKRAEKDDSDS